MKNKILLLLTLLLFAALITTFVIYRSRKLKGPSDTAAASGYSSVISDTK